MIGKFKLLKASDASDRMREWMQSYKTPNLEDDYEKVRQEIESIFEGYREYKTEISKESRKDYLSDIYLGVKLYVYFQDKEWFNLRVAADNSFWRYMSIMVVPHLIGERWGKNNEDHYWRKPNRIWLKTIWWYIFLSWQGNEEDTLKILSFQGCDTDVILNIIERSGRKGMNVRLYREIMRRYSMLNLSDIQRFRSQNASKKSLFRSIMCLNTARSAVLEPSLVDGGIEEYVNNLFAFFSL